MDFNRDGATGEKDAPTGREGSDSEQTQQVVTSMAVLNANKIH